MNLYFSGVASTEEARMLQTAGVKLYLSDMQDSVNVPVDYGEFALDSGAYRAWKAGKPLETTEWMNSLHDWYDRTRLGTPSFVVMPDILGDWQATWNRWQAVKSIVRRCVPVWQWGAPIGHLEEMIEDTKGLWWTGESLVCVGGLVPHFRAQDESVLSDVVEICRKYGQSLHILGLNWLHAIEVLKPLVYSCDTSKWIDGARYGHIIYQDTRTGHLVYSHKHAHPEFTHATREELCIACAKNLDAYVNGKVDVVPVCGNENAKEYALKPDLVFIPKKKRERLDKIEASNHWQSFLFTQENEKRKEKAKMLAESRQ